MNNNIRRHLLRKIKVLLSKRKEKAVTPVIKYYYWYLGDQFLGTFVPIIYEVLQENERLNNSNSQRDLLHMPFYLKYSKTHFETLRLYIFAFMFNESLNVRNIEQSSKRKV